MNRNRFRKLILITGTTLSVLIAIAFVASARWWFGPPGWPSVCVDKGAVALTLGYRSGWASGVHEGQFARWNSWNLVPDIRVDLEGGKVRIDELGAIGIWIPLYGLFLAVALPTLLVWRLVPRFPDGHCRHCGYNLEGNTSGTCPECGECID